MKFVIVSYRQFAGGPIVLHKLAQILIKLGYSVKIFYIGNGIEIKQTRVMRIKNYISFYIKDFIKYIIGMCFKKSGLINSRYKGYGYVPIKGVKRKWIPVVDDDTVVIYPEVVYGNPLNAKMVVRWLLYYNRYKGENGWSSKDLVVTYRDIFNDKELNPRGYVLHCSHFDSVLYRNFNKGDRKGNCYIIRKGSGRLDLPQKFDGPVIDNLSEFQIVDIFNKCERCYSYDTQTFYSSIAALCGCQSIVVMEPGKSKKDYCGKDDDDYGVAYGDSLDEIKRAEMSKVKLEEKIMRWDSENFNSVKNFITICYNHFKNV